MKRRIIGEFTTGSDGNLIPTNQKKRRIIGEYTTDSNGQLTRVKSAQSTDESYVINNDWLKIKKSTYDNMDSFNRTSQASVIDSVINIGEGVGGLFEGVVDLGAYILSGGADLFGMDKTATDIKKWAQDNQVSKLGKWARDTASDITNNDIEANSIYGSSTDAVFQGVGQVGGMLATGGMAGAAGAGAGTANAIVTGTNFLSSTGRGMSDAYNEGATDKEAIQYGLMQGTIEAASEAMFGGLGKASGLLGMSKGFSALDDKLATTLTSKIKSKLGKTLIQYGVKAGAEGTEEVVSGALSAVAKKLTYKSEEELMQLVKDEKLLDQFIVGSLVSGIAQGGDVATSLATGRDLITNYTANEQTVIDKLTKKRISEREAEDGELSKKEKSKIGEQVKKDLEHGRIDIDDIESILGGEHYSNYTKRMDSETKLQKEIAELRNIPESKITVGQRERLTEARQELADLQKVSTKDLKDKLASEVDSMTQNDTYIRESYNEKGRRSQAYTADVSKYDEGQRATIQNAIDSGILNDTRRTHEFVDMVARLSADKGVSFDFSNSQKIKDTGYAIEGKTVNGYVQGDKVTLNVNSVKALNKVVGHEITHVLEGTDLYSELKAAVKAYAESKGEYESRLEEIKALYKDQNADIDNELTADLIGDYLFTDEDFINNLSAEQPGIFKKMYEEIKYLIKIVTAGTKEAKQFEKVKRAFDKAYKTTSEIYDSNVKYMLNENYQKEVDEWYNNKENYDKHGGYFNVGRTSEALQSIDVKEQDILFDKAKIKEILKKHDGMTIDVIKEVPNVVENPVLVMQSKTVTNSITLFGEVYSDGVPVMVAMQLKPKGKSGRVLDIIKISSAYENTKAQGLIDTSDILYLDPDKKRTDTWLGALGLQLPSGLTEYGPINKVTYYEDIVKDEATGKNTMAEALKKALGKNESIKTSLSYNKETLTGGYNIYGSDIALDDDVPIRSDLATSQEIDPNIRELAEALEKKTEAAVDYEPDPDNFGQPIKTVQQREAAKLENYKVELASKKRQKEDSYRQYNRDIAEQEEYLRKEKDQNSEDANTIKARIAELKTTRDNIQADLDKSINVLKKRIKKMSTPEYKRNVQKQQKQSEIRAEISEIMGDTTNWQDKDSGLGYKLHTLKRNLREVVGDVERADNIYRYLQGSYNQNEAKLNTELANTRQVYADMKINKYENQYIQMLGEYRYNPETELTYDKVNGFYEKHKAKIDSEKVDRVIDMARNTYDDLFTRVNEVLREYGIKEIPYREGYFPHLNKEPQGIIAKLLNWKKEDNSIPTDIAGLTESFKPNKSYQSFAQRRTGDTTDYDFLAGLDMYTAGALDWIHHIGDIQRFRAFENEIRYRHSDEGIKEKIKKIEQDVLYDADEAQAQMDAVYAEAKNPLNNLVQNIRTHTNLLAGKKNTMDRAIEEDFNRNIYSVVKNASSRINANMVGGSISSALTNFIPITQSWSQVSPLSSLKAMGDTIKSTMLDDGTIAKSAFLTNRLRKADNLSKSTWDKVSDKISFMMEAVDSFTSQTIWRSKYMENIKQGMSESEAILNADEFAEGVMAGRSRGNMPVIFESKNPITKIFTAFQLEVANQYDYMFKDMPADMKEKTKGQVVKAYGTMFVGAYVYNALYSSLTGRDAAFDPIGIIQDLLTDLFDDDEDNTSEFALNLIDAVGDEVPYIGGVLFDGGRIPISSALPYGEGLYEMVTGTIDDVSAGNVKTLTKEWLNPLYYLAVPAGGGQLKKTVEGLSMYDDDLPIAGSYTDKGALRFSVEDNLASKVQAGLFGQWSSKNAREYIEEGRTPLSGNKLEEYTELADTGMTMQEYWNYRDGMKGLSKTADKMDYIASLDVTTEQKNIMANYVVDRDAKVDLDGYEKYGEWAEFDFAMTEPEKYQVSRAVGGYSTYATHTATINKIESDKDEDGETINGSRKQKVIEYINGIEDMSTEQKYVLYKYYYKSDDTYNQEIVDYLNSNKDISSADMKTILLELGFTIRNGKIYD